MLVLVILVKWILIVDSLQTTAWVVLAVFALHKVLVKCALVKIVGKYVEVVYIAKAINALHTSHWERLVVHQTHVDQQPFAAPAVFALPMAL